MYFIGQRAIGAFCTLLGILSTVAGAAPGSQSYASSSFPPSTSPSGCGKQHLFNGITQYHDLKSGHRDRSYSIHLPITYNASCQYPLVFGFHGSGGIGLFFEVDTKLSEPRFSGDRIMVYPNGVGGAWAGPSYAKTSVAEDLQFVQDLLHDIKGEYCINDRKVYVTGISNGGGFVDTIACSPIGRSFAAFAPASGSFYTDSKSAGCDLARSPLPVLEIHGGSDRTVHYEGGQGEGGIEPSITDWLGFWAKRDGCTSMTQTDSFDDNVHHLSWVCDGTNGVLQHYKIDDMDHVWASTEPNFSQIAAGQGPTHIEASRVIMDFFDLFEKP